MRSVSGGFTLIELLVTLAIVSIVLSGVVGSFAAQNRLYIRQDRLTELEANLRLGMDMATDLLRTGGSGVPCANLALWIPWVAGFAGNPDILAGPPDTLSIAAVFQEPIATLTADAAAGATSLALSSTTGLDIGSQSLLLIDWNEHIRVTATQPSLTIDTDPTQAGNQGLSRPYLIGTPVSRVDVRTLWLDGDTLVLDENQGSSPIDLVGNITNFEATPIFGDQYELAVTAAATVPNATPGMLTVTRDLVSIITVRNADGCNSF